MSESCPSEAQGGPVADWIDDLYHAQGGDEGVEKFLREQYARVKPYIDIPYVPAAFEGVIHGALENMLVRAVKELHKRIHNDD